MHRYLAFHAAGFRARISGISYVMCFAMLMLETSYVFFPFLFAARSSQVEAVRVVGRLAENFFYRLHRVMHVSSLVSMAG